MSERILIARPLTREAFAPFGDVLDKRAEAARPMNGGRALRFPALAEACVADTDGRVVIGLVAAQPYAMPLTLRLVERHPLGSQAFMPLNGAPFLVVVCPDEGDRPGRPQAFVTAPGQGVSYHRGTWHGVLTPFGAAQDFLVVDRGGPGANLDEHPFEQPWRIHLPDDAPPPRG